MINYDAREDGFTFLPLTPHALPLTHLVLAAMSLSTLALIFLSLCVGSGVWLFFLWAVRKGEFDDPEGPKYRMLDDDDDKTS